MGLPVDFCAGSSKLEAFFNLFRPAAIWDCACRGNQLRPTLLQHYMRHEKGDDHEIARACGTLRRRSFDSIVITIAIHLLQLGEG